ncbi:LytR C-terminal domain-containing protein [Allobranchiibius sp. CTAmp26]|uniref:LytR C-terminal domain-containing protein n=1 Tax=Allobranchiibius sp. CTAmp26 TaxID=2815214 RepID=UPI001AA18A97|nr:LytR C-terminal domain-containing protein [Allobranchiibius sp. CTAmp26]MBO1756729.1 LytR C-terminal domain-containing protein [Allobranchiibius sp. CTAmp26]
MSTASNGLQAARRRRRIRATVVLVIAAVLVIAGLVYAVRNISPPSAAPTGPSTPSCTTLALPQALVKLNIYNASDSSGSARDVATKFASGGFDIGSISNDPYKQKIDGVAQIRFGATGQDFAKRYVLPRVPGATLARDGRSDSSVDLVLGKDFRADVPTASPSTTC